MILYLSQNISVFKLNDTLIIVPKFQFSKYLHHKG